MNNDNKSHLKCFSKLIRRVGLRKCGKCGVNDIGENYISVCDKCSDLDAKYVGY